MPKPRIVILAEPNGAGKSTVAKYLLTEKYFIDEFVNADAIAVGLSAFAPGDVAFQAGRIMLQRIDALLKGKRSFAFETTLASKSFTRLIARAQSSGYRVVVDEWFVYDNSELKTPSLVAQGQGTGENIIEEQKWQRLLKLAKTNER